MTDQDESKLPVSVDVGFKLGASLEVKTEIPAEDTGRLVAALTDVIRPFTESMGLKADRIRLQREDVLIQIAKKTRERAKLENVEIKPVPNKLFVSLLEKASVEDIDDETMQDRWASLLLSASKAFQAKHLTFVDILNRLSADELMILEETCFAYKAFPETSYPQGHSAENIRHIQSQRGHLNGAPRQLGGERALEFMKAAPLNYGGYIHVSVGINDGSSVFTYTGFHPSGPKFVSLEILEKERLVSIHNYHIDGQSVGYFEITKLGVSFVMECSPDAAKMAARRPPPVQLRPVDPAIAAKIAEGLKRPAR